MSKERWSDAKVNAFISRYLHFPALWNVKNPVYSMKSAKEEAMAALQNEFEMSLAEVRNKIRIYRTTFSQELKKIELNPSYKPKLSWFHSMNEAFREGKVKSFSKKKTPKRERDIKSESQNLADIEIEYREVDDSDDGEVTKYDIKRRRNEDPIDHNEKYSEEQFQVSHIIVEQDDLDSDEPEEIRNTLKADDSNTDVAAQIPSSNELFLKSLKSTLDALPHERNMFARIKIQEALYQIAFGPSHIPCSHT